ARGSGQDPRGPSGPNLDWDFGRRLVRTSAGYVGPAVANRFFLSDILVVSLLLGPEQAALYGVAYKLTDLCLQVIYRISDNLRPFFASAQTSGSLRELEALHGDAVRWSIRVALCLAAGLALAGEPVARVWVGPHSTAPWSLFAVLSLWLLVEAWVYPSFLVLHSLASVVRPGRVMLAEALAKNVLGVFLVTRFGLIGVPLGSIIARLALSA